MKHFWINQDLDYNNLKALKEKGEKKRKQHKQQRQNKKLNRRK